MKISNQVRFTRAVTVLTPVDGGHKEEQIKVTYELISTTESRELLGDGTNATAFLERVVVGLDGVVADDNTPLAYSEKLRDVVLELPHARAAIAAAYWAATGKVKAGN